MDVLLQLLLLLVFVALIAGFFILKRRSPSILSKCPPCYPTPKATGTTTNTTNTISDRSGKSPFYFPVNDSVPQIITLTSGPQLTGADRAGQPPVVIIGGGLTGLITAYQLTKARIPFVLLESRSHLGGRISTIRYPNGDTSEAPLEEYWERSPTVPLLRELGVKMHKDDAHSSVMIDNQVIVGNGDPSASEYLTNMFPDGRHKKAFLKWNDKVWSLYKDIKKYCLDVHASHLSTYVEPPTHLKELMNISFADFVLGHHDGQLLPRRVSEWIRVTLEPEIATEWDTITALDGIDEMRIFLNTPDGFGENNYHLEKGNTEFIKQLVSFLPAGCVRLNCAVKDIDSLGLPDNGNFRNFATAEAARKYEADLKLPVVTYLQSHPADVKDIVQLKASYIVITIPLPEVNTNIRFNPPLDMHKKLALEGSKMGSYIKIHLYFKHGVNKCYLPKYGDKLFTLLTDNLFGSIYDSTREPPLKNAGCPLDSTSSTSLQTTSSSYPLQTTNSSAGVNGGATPVHLTVLLHAKHAERMCKLEPDEIKQQAVDAMEHLFPGVSPFLQEVEVFKFRQAVAHWPIKHKRSRFDFLAHHLRTPFGGPDNRRIFFGGDTTYGSHSEGAALSAFAISKNIQELWKH